jgi:hypothetical protein
MSRKTKRNNKDSRTRLRSHAYMISTVMSRKTKLHTYRRMILVELGYPYYAVWFS